MKARLLSLPYSILITSLVGISLGQSAFAGGTGPDRDEHPLWEAESGSELALPASLNEWKDAAEEVDLGEVPIVSLSQFPQGRLTQKPSFIDYSHWEIGAFLSAVEYSGSFKSLHKPEGAIGISTRVPVPGIPLGDWGGWGEIFVSHISRNIPIFYPKRSGDWYGGALGADYGLIKTDLIFLRAEAGLMYAEWNHINALKNGAGVIVGADFGWYWIKNYNRASLSITPQLNFDSKNWIGLINFGFSYDF
jgi:hypothetical protein